MNLYLLIPAALILIYILLSLKVVRQSERGLVETLGKYSDYAEPGMKVVLLGFQRIIIVDITENMVEVDKQMIITKDRLNAEVNAQVYFKVKEDEENVYNSEYKVSNYYVQIVQLARTTLRNIIGTMTVTEANSERNKINKALMEHLTKETKYWGIEVVRTELKEIDPPLDVQQSMNQIVIAQTNKQAAVDFATAAETKADGLRRAAIKEADGEKTAAIMRAEGQAKSIELVNNAANKYFIGNAQKLKQLEVTQASLESNSKIVITEKGISPTIILGNEKVVPIK